MAEEGSLCGICWQGTLLLQQGFLVCDVCGNFVQGFVEETAEYQGGTQTHFHRRTVRATPLGDKSFAQREAPQLLEATLAYLGCLQRLLQRQAVALRDGLGVNPLIVTVLERLWFAYLPQCEVLEPGFMRRLEARIQPSLALAGVEGEEGEELPAAARNVPMVLGEALVKALPPSTTLALCLLGCWQLREAVGPLELVRWALSGRLPYLRLAAESREALEPFARVLPLHFLDTRGAPNPTRLWDTAALVASLAALPCPPANVGLWLDRWARELALPQAVVCTGLQLYRLYRHGCPQYHLQHGVLAQAPVHVMALLVVAVKLLYGLDGKRRRVLDGVPPPPDWLRWAKAVVGSTQWTSQFLLPLNEALDLSDPAFQLYLQHAAAQAFPGGATPEGLEDFRRLLEGLGAAHAAAAAQQRQQGGQQQWQAHGEASMQGQQPQRKEREEEEQQMAFSAGGPEGDSSGAVGRAAQWRQLFERAWQPAAPAVEAAGRTGGEGSEGDEAEPALPAGAYPFFGRAFGPGSGNQSWHVPLDYALVLTVCAMHVGVMPNLLHSVVSELEQGMISAEVEVAYAHDLQAQGQLEGIQQLAERVKSSKSEYESALLRLRQEQPDLLPGFTAELEGLEEEGRARKQAKDRAARAARAKGQPAQERAKGRKGNVTGRSRGGGRR